MSRALLLATCADKDAVTADLAAAVAQSRRCAALPLPLPRIEAVTDAECCSTNTSTDVPPTLLHPPPPSSWRQDAVDDGAGTGAGVAQRLLHFGAAHVAGVVSPALCGRVLNDIRTQLLLPSAGTTGDIGSPGNRIDLMMPLTPAVHEAVTLLYTRWRESCWDVLTPNAWCIECSALVSWVGASDQAWHVDTYMSGEAKAGQHDARVITVALALADIGHALGPTEFRLRSHHLADSASARAYGGQGAVAWCKQDRVEHEHVAGTAMVGDVILWDSNCVHRGGAHTHGPPRPLLYVTFLGDDGPCPEGSTHSLLPEYGGKFRAGERFGGGGGVGSGGGGGDTP